MATTITHLPNVMVSGAMRVLSDSIDLAPVAANTSAAQEVALSSTGILAVGDFIVLLDAGTVSAGLQVACVQKVATADKVKFLVANCTAGTVDNAPTTMTFLHIPAAQLAA